MNIEPVLHTYTRRLMGLEKGAGWRKGGEKGSMIWGVGRDEQLGSPGDKLDLPTLPNQQVYSSYIFDYPLGRPKKSSLKERIGDN